MRSFGSPAELGDVVGESLGHSDWVQITQRDIDLFAEATGDHQWIHVDPERAAAGPFGTTIAHGFLTLSLLPRLWSQIYSVEGVTTRVNYGLNKVRFPSPVPVGSRVRAEATLTALDVLDDAGTTYQLTLTSSIEVDGASKPACVAESVLRFIV